MKFLAEIAKDFVVRVGVAGSHGKTTTTAMLGNILNQAQSNYLLHLGGEDNNLGNFFYTGKDIFLSEICEYKKNIKNIDVDIACVLNVDYDHVDCYSDISEVKQVMFDYLNRSKYRIINNDDILLLEYSGGSLTYAINNNADVTAKNIRSTNFSTLFDVYYKNRFQFCVEISSTGIYNVYNALCAICVAMLLNISTSNIINGLKAFNGVKRRMEVIGEVNGARIICDYAHHPREIENAVACLKKTATGKVHVVFQPHTYSRTSKLIDDFVECFSQIENLCIYKTYPAREEYDYYGSAKNLFVKTKSATKYFEESDQLKNHLREEVGKNDTVLVLGAGDIYNIVKECILCIVLNVVLKMIMKINFV
jgi:UDP-N-acetylmuramate--alanine ligase